jgi:hypothetical protein
VCPRARLPRGITAVSSSRSSEWLVDQLVAFYVVGNLVDQFDWKFAEWVILYAGDLSGERLFDAFSFFGEDII